MAGYPDAARLGDIGERAIVGQILAPRYRDGNLTFGDDVADFGTIGGGVLVATTDPAPLPVVWEFFERDFFDWGWLLAALNLSDLAAAGADPLGLLTSLTMPNDTLVSDFVRLLDGIDAVCHQVGTQVRGGNLKESERAVCEATALGYVDGTPLSRLGAEPGDALYAFGEVGLFWAAVLRAETHGGRAMTDVREGLARPRPLVSLGRAIRTSGAAKACMDASDGLYAAICGLTSDQELGFLLQADEVVLSPRAKRLADGLDVEPVRFALGFGNLELVCAADASQESRLLQLARRNRVHMTKLGIVQGESGIRVQRRGISGLMTNFDNERFTPTSQFTTGLSSFRERLMGQPLSRTWA
jgi:thiamine-monophosphate kinase